MALGDILGPGGALSRALPLYEPRASQLEMAERVEHALSKGRALVVEAGTGTGKTLAYLLPAAKSG
ncbi:MAG TPA: DEAD/DEAH box helicase, partial [Myxococcales bacterium]